MRWFRSHPHFVTIVLVVLIVAPGYWRQEQAIDRSERAIERAERAIERVEEVDELTIEQRDEARMNACKGDRVFGLAHNGLVQYLADASKNASQATIDAYLKANLVFVRECTPEAIADFYEEGPETESVPVIPPAPNTSSTVRRTTTTGSTSTTAGAPTSTTFHSAPAPTDPPCVLPMPTLPPIPCL